MGLEILAEDTRVEAFLSLLAVRTLVNYVTNVSSLVRLGVQEPTGAEGQLSQ